MSSGEGHRGSQRPHVELTIHWSSRNKQRVTALADTLNVPKYDNFQKLCGSLSGIDSYGGQTVTVRKSPMLCKVGAPTSRSIEVFISPIPKTYWELIS